MNQPALASVTIWVAGWNMPGYLPETAPAHFAEWQTAHGYIHDKVQRFWDDDQVDRPTAPGVNNPTAICCERDVADCDCADAKWLPVDTALNTATHGEPWSAMSGDDRLVFWIERRDRSLTLEDLGKVLEWWNNDWTDYASDFDLSRASVDELLALANWRVATDAMADYITSVPHAEGLSPERLEAKRQAMLAHLDLITEALIQIHYDPEGEA